MLWIGWTWTDWIYQTFASGTSSLWPIEWAKTRIFESRPNPNFWMTPSDPTWTQTWNIIYLFQFTSDGYKGFQTPRSTPNLLCSVSCCPINMAGSVKCDIFESIVIQYESKIGWSLSVIQIYLGSYQWYIFIWNWSRERDVVINLWVNEKQAKGTKGREIVGGA